MELKEILKLMEEKYPENYQRGTNPALLIYGDESGRIVKDAIHHAYGGKNLLFEFNTIEELVNHLQEKTS